MNTPNIPPNEIEGGAEKRPDEIRTQGEQAKAGPVPVSVKVCPDAILFFTQAAK